MVEKRANKFGQGPPPFFGQCPKENVFYKRCSLSDAIFLMMFQIQNIAHPKGGYRQ